MSEYNLEHDLQELAMKNRSTLYLIAFVFSLIIGVVIIQTTIEKRDSKSQFTVGIIKTTSHPALELACNGFTKTVSDELESTVDFVICNAHGSQTQLETIAHQFHTNNNINLIYALGTPAAQAMARVEKEKPIVVAAVSNPHELSEGASSINITGSSDITDPLYHINYLKQLMPQVKTVAILYSSSEHNSRNTSKKIIESMLQAGLNPVSIAVENNTVLTTALDNALKNADVLFIPTDNMLCSVMQTISQKAQSAKKPIWVCDNSLISYPNIIASYGIDYETNGMQAAHAALEILTLQKKPYEIAVAHAPKDILLVNKKTLDEFNLTIPDELEPWTKLIS